MPKQGSLFDESALPTESVFDADGNLRERIQPETDMTIVLADLMKGRIDVKDLPF